jgi:hypothetical protein
VGGALLVWGVLLVALDGAAEGFSTASGSTRAAICAATAIALSVKPSAAPLFAVAAVFVLSAPGARLRYALTALAAAIALPALLRNALLTGYPLYPFLWPALRADWTLPSAIANDAFAWTRSWSRIPSPAPGLKVVLAMSAREWVPRWWSWVFGTDKALLVASALLLVPGAFRLRRRPAAFLVVGTCVVALVLWFLSAPDPRLAWGFLLFLPLLLGAGLLPDAMRARLPLAWGGLLLLAVILVRDTRLAMRKAPDGGWGGLGVVAPYPMVPLTDIRTRGAVLHVPRAGEQCWDAPLPCIPKLEHPVEPRGAALSDGYRHPPGAPLFERARD